jgi:hypothetical protein
MIYMNEQHEKLYEITIEDGYLRTNVWGAADADIFEASTNELLTLRDAHRVPLNRLLCDIRRLKPNNIDIVAQTRGIGALWKIRSFDKVAVVIGDTHVSDMLHQALKVTHFTDKFQTFDDEAEAVAWLKQ